MSDIIARIIETRRKAITSGQIPRCLTLSPDAAVALHQWISEQEHDPFLGYTPFGQRLMGMVFLEDPSQVEDIKVHNECPS